MRYLLPLVVVLILLFPASASPSSKSYCAHPTPAQLASLPHQYPSFSHALHHDFGRHWVEAAVVAYGEGSWHSWATNGQYRGTFQMGYRERETYGDSPTLPGQTHAAHRYWSHGGWSHWDCQPW